MLAAGGDHHKYVVEGGAWWRDAKKDYAERSGDDETYRRLKNEQHKELAALTEGIREAFACMPQRPPIAGYELRIGYKNGDTRVLDFASRRKANHMAQTLSDDVVFWEIWRLYAGRKEV